MSEARNNNKLRYNFKIVIVGQFGVGKSSLLHKFITGTFSPRVQPNTRADSEEIRLLRHDKPVKLKIVDTAGQERYRSLTGSYFRETDGVIIAFDVTNEESFNELGYWFDQVKTNVDTDSMREVVQILVATRCHEKDKRVISEGRGYKRAQEANIEYMEVSAEVGTNVQQLFETISDQMIEELEESHNSMPSLQKLIRRHTDTGIQRIRSNCC